MRAYQLQYDHVRAHPQCPICDQPKGEGVVLCWRCHHIEKQENDGRYSSAALGIIAAREQRLASNPRR